MRLSWLSFSLHFIARSRHEMVACGVLPIDRMTQHWEAVQVVANRVGRSELERVYNIRLADPKP